MEASFLSILGGRTAKWSLKEGWAPYAISLALLSALIGLQIGIGKVAYEVYSQDVFVVLDGVLQLQKGHRIHEDFSSTVGIFYLLPYYIATFFGPLKGMTIVYGNALVGLLAFGLAAFASKDRMPAVWGAVFSFYVGLLSISPHLLSLNVSLLNYWNQAFYNRFGWSFVSILCVLLVLPRREPSENYWKDVDAAVCGLLLFFLFYLKLTYFAAGIGLLCITLIADFQNNLRRSVIALASFVGAVVIMELATGITIPYLSDLARIFVVAHPSRLKDLVDISINNYYSVILTMLIAGASAILGGGSKGTLARLVSIVAILGLGLVLATYNHKSYDIPLVPVAALIATLAFSPWTVEANYLSWWSLLLTSVVALNFAKPIGLDVVSLLRAEHKALASDSKIGWMQGTPISDLAVTQKPNELVGKTSKERPFCCVENDSEYFYWLSDGVTLLKPHVRPDDTVLAFAWANPFPTLLGLPPVKHTLLWWDEYRTFSSASSPKPSELLGGVNYVMIPKTDMPWGPAPLMNEIYGEELRAKFSRIDESAYWTLYARR